MELSQRRRTWLVTGQRSARTAAAAATLLLMAACGSQPPTPGSTSRSSVPSSQTTSRSGPPLTGRIVYGRFDGDSVSMFTARPDGTGVRPLLAGSGGEPRQWSPDGTLLAVTETNQGNMIGSVVRADGTHQLMFRLPPATPAALPCGFWSPDASRLTCEGFDDAHPERAGVYTVRATDGQGLVRVTRGRDVPCSYSADGKRILFVHLPDAEAEHGHLMSVLTDGSDERPVIQDVVGLSCDWSPDGKTILSERGGSLLVIDSSRGVHPVPIAPGGSACCGQFSPDGSHIIFSLNLGSQKDIYIVRTDGSDLTQITDTPANEEFADWGP